MIVVAICYLQWTYKYKLGTLLSILLPPNWLIMRISDKINLMYNFISNPPFYTFGKITYNSFSFYYLELFKII